MKSKITLLLVLFAFLSCDIQYDPEVRLVFRTSVTDNSGNSLSGQQVSVMVSEGSLVDEIATGFTDDNGKLELIFPAPKNNEAKFAVRYAGDAILQEKLFLNIQRSDFANYKFAINDVGLYPYADLTSLLLTLNQMTNDSISDIYLEGIDMQPIVYYHQLPNEQLPTQFTVLKNSQAILHYTTTPEFSTVSEFHTQTIPIGNDVTEFTINF